MVSQAPLVYTVTWHTLIIPVSLSTEGPILDYEDYFYI